MANYRQQTGSSLLASTPCSSCFQALSLCFSSVDANGVCCGTSSSVTVYIGSQETFATASNLYATSSLGAGALATAGFYSDDSGTC
jgi:hypothetical protein